MGGRLGYPDFDNDIEFGGPEYFEDIEQWVDRIVDPVVDTPDHLPATGNWVGRKMFVTATNQIAVCKALPASWARFPVAPPWKQDVRTATDSYSSGAFRNIHNTTLADAVDGIYEWGAALYLGASAANAGNVRMMIGTTNLMAVDPPFDFTSATRQAWSGRGFYRHTGGDLTLSAYDFRSAGSGTIYAGSTLTLRYVSGS